MDYAIGAGCVLKNIENLRPEKNPIRSTNKPKPVKYTRDRDGYDNLKSAGQEVQLVMR